MTKGRSGSAFNILSVVLLGLTALACLCYTTVFFVPTLAGPFAGPTPVRAVQLPTATPTVLSLPPTWTPTVPGPPTETSTPFFTTTPEPTETQRFTITPAPTRTKTVTPGPSPTASPTRSKYPYTGAVTYQLDPAYGCGGSVIMGTITDLAGQPVTAGSIAIHVEGDGDVDTGGELHPGQEFRGGKMRGASPYTGILGPSSWNVIINLSGTTAGTWRVWLIRGGQISDQIEVHFSGACGQSSAVVRFQQNH
jgi:hypothetical protein